MSENNVTQDDFDDSEPSKSEIKRQLQAITDLGKTLCSMSLEQIKKAPLNPDVLEAIEQYHRCKSFGAKKRQLLYVGKQLRNEPIDEIHNWLNGETVEQKMQVLNMHTAERWRDALIENPGSLSELIDAYPEAATMNFNQLIRQAKQEQNSNKPPKFYRQLYQRIFTIVEDASNNMPPAN